MSLLPSRVPRTVESNSTSSSLLVSYLLFTWLIVYYSSLINFVDLVDEDLKMILGMVWAIILDYQIKGISVEGIYLHSKTITKINIA